MSRSSTPRRVRGRSGKRNGGGGGYSGSTGPFPPLAAYELVTTLCGTGQRGMSNGPLEEAAIDNPGGACALPSGEIIVADGNNNAMRMIDRQLRVVKTLGGGKWLGPASPVCIEDGAALLVCDTGHNKVRMLQLGASAAHGGSDDDGNGRVPVTDTAIAGTGRRGCADGPARRASFAAPTGLCVISDGSVLVADSLNHCIRRIAGRPGKRGLFVTTIAGSPGQRGFADGCGDRALFDTPVQLCVDLCGTVLVADSRNHAVRALHPPLPEDPACDVWSVTTVAGTGRAGFVDGTEAVAQFRAPTDLVIDPDGFLLVADAGNAAIRCIGSNPGPPVGSSGRAAAGRGNTPLSWLERLPVSLGDDDASEATSAVGDGAAAGATPGSTSSADKRARRARARGRVTRRAARSVEELVRDRREEVIATERLEAGASPSAVHRLLERITDAHRRYAFVQVLAGPPANRPAPPVAPPASTSPSRATSPAREVGAGGGREAMPAKRLRSPATAAAADAFIRDQMAAAVPYSDRYRDGRCEAARFRSPRALCVLPNDGCVLVSDTTNHLIRLLVPRHALMSRQTPLRALFSSEELRRAGATGEELVGEVAGDLEVDPVVREASAGGFGGGRATARSRSRSRSRSPRGGRSATASQPSVAGSNGHRMQYELSPRKTTVRPVGVSPYRRSTAAWRSRTIGSPGSSAAAHRARTVQRTRPGSGTGGGKPPTTVWAGEAPTAVSRAQSARSTRGRGELLRTDDAFSYDIVRQHHPSFKGHAAATHAAQRRDYLDEARGIVADGVRRSREADAEAADSARDSWLYDDSRAGGGRIGHVVPRDLSPVRDQQHPPRKSSKPAPPPGRGSNRAPGMAPKSPSARSRRSTASGRTGGTSVVFHPVVPGQGRRVSRVVATAGAQLQPTPGRPRSHVAVAPPPPPGGDASVAAARLDVEELQLLNKIGASFDKAPPPPDPSAAYLHERAGENARLRALQAAQLDAAKHAIEAAMVTGAGGGGGGDRRQSTTRGL